MEKITEIIEQAKSGWNKIDKKKKITMVALFVGVLLFVSIFTYSKNKVNYVTLFKDLEFQDAGNIVSDLEANKMAYKLENNGRNILVDEKTIDKYRLQLAMTGMMPENSSGFEIFDSIGLMVTDDDRKIMYQRALTGELQRTIMSLEVVNSAKVHLMMPVKSIFETEERQASASIVIDLKPNEKITNDTIRGIAALVSGAVDNLPEENIQIIDSKGNLLSNVLQSNNELNTMDVLNQYESVREEFQRKTENNLRDLLGGAFGLDKIKVSVYADLDFDAEETTSITYDNPVIRSQQISVTGSNVTSQQVAAGNINDNISNVVIDSLGDGSTYDSTTNNELSTETKTIIKAPGKVNRLTTSIIYDGYLSEENSTKIHNIVATATGFDNDRGDRINVEGIAFDKSFEEQLAKDLEDIKQEMDNKKSIFGKYDMYVKIGLASLVILMIIILFIASRRKSKNKLKYMGQVAVDGDIIVAIDELQEKIEVKEDNKRLTAQNYAKENPEMATDLIKAWLKD